jgi:hypothetical protein
MIVVIMLSEGTKENCALRFETSYGEKFLGILNEAEGTLLNGL